MKVLVTGANGMLGQDLCPILEDFGYEVIETDCSNLDITDKKMCVEKIKSENPDYVFHCAAYTNVDKAEEEQDKAMLVNADGTENVAKVCAELDIPIIYISTDYVFDGEKSEPYTISDNPNPLNVYGKSKLKGEEAVKKYCEKYYIIRTSWLYGHHGKNFVETMINAAAEKNELKVVDDQRGCPTWTVDLSNCILDILEKPYGIYHICGAGETTWYGFAKEIFKLEGIKVSLKPCSSQEYLRPAKRPQYSVLDKNCKCRFWRDALKDYLMLRD